MSDTVSVTEHLDRVRRVRSVACPKCHAPVGRPCTSPKGVSVGIHHQARYAALYKRKGNRA
jgi:hypothetical protein